MYCTYNKQFYCTYNKQIFMIRTIKTCLLYVQWKSRYCTYNKRCRQIRRKISYKILNPSNIFYYTYNKKLLIVRITKHFLLHIQWKSLFNNNNCTYNKNIIVRTEKCSACKYTWIYFEYLSILGSPWTIKVFEYFSNFLDFWVSWPAACDQIYNSTVK